VFCNFIFFCSIMFEETGLLVTAPQDVLPLPRFFDFFSGSDLWLWIWLVIVFVWVVILLWVIKDITARTNSFWWQFLSVCLIIFLTPVIGLPLYLALRPLGLKYDKTLWRDVLLLSVCACPNCGMLNKIEHTCCTNCGDPVQTQCRECSEYYVSEYDYCPDCWAPNIRS